RASSQRVSVPRSSSRRAPVASPGRVGVSDIQRSRLMAATVAALEELGRPIVRTCSPDRCALRPAHLRLWVLD
ncbi:MAG TPA: hypothetical protein VNV42_12020, partial [Solirubrobacteraceae bacterium]|nr:hypothetical protein [Solirubrobacteraceae bacterium]